MAGSEQKVTGLYYILLSKMWLMANHRVKITGNEIGMDRVFLWNIFPELGPDDWYLQVNR